LGLANVRNYCEIMGGIVGVESKAGGGSTFTIRLPSKVTTPHLRPTSAVDDREILQPPEGSKTVLVIDDDPQWRESMLRLLTREGLHAITAASGEEGIRRARQIKPSVIALDVAMPTMDGWAVLAELKSDPDLADIPVVMLTLVDNKKIGYTLGASDYLTKPVDRNKLLQVLNRFAHPSDSKPVLVVEDDLSIRSKICQILEKEGWTVVEAENGREALSRMEEETPAIILLDLLMPVMNGFEFIEIVRQRGEWKEVPVVVVTALELTEEDRVRLNGYVEKVLQKQENTEEELLREIGSLVKSCLAEDPGKPGS